MALRTPLTVSPHMYIGDSTGRPLDLGMVYFGEPDKDPEFYPIDIFSDDGLMTPVSQPVRTKGGYLNDNKGDMAEIHAKELIYSVKVLDQYGRKIFYKGQSMRSNWNDDVIIRIDEAIIESSVRAEQVARDIATEAIDGVAVDSNLVSDALTKTVPKGDNTIARTQRAINANITYAKDFGLAGDGITDDTVKFNLALLTLSNLAKADGQPRCLALDPSCTYIVTGGLLQPLVDIICLAGTATLKRKDVPEGTPENVATWWRIAVPDISKWVTDVDYAHRVKLHNIIFDGNMANARWTFNTYNQEQASSLMLYGRKDGITDLSKRAKFDVRGLHFKDSVSDGLHIVSNADVTGGNCTAEKCFRGGLVITGGNSKVNIDGWISDDARGDIEIDSGGTNESFASFITVHNYKQDIDGGADNLFAGGIDLGSVGNGGSLDVDGMQVFTPPFNWSMGRNVNDKPKNYSVRNSIFHVTNDTANNPTEGLFKNVKFILRNDVTRSAGIKINPAFFYAQTELTDMVWDNVAMELFSKLPEHALIASPIAIASQADSNKVRLKIINSDFSKVTGDIYLFDCKNGGRLYLDDISINTTNFISAKGSETLGAEKLATNITLGKINFGANTTTFMYSEYSATSTIPNYIEFLPNFVVPQRVNVFPYMDTFTGIPKTVVGNRTILGALPPLATVSSYKGDFYRLEEPVVGKPYEWISTKSSIVYTVSATWQATKWLVGSFTTANLPVLTAYDKGCQNIDTTLNKVVTWTGTAWI